MCRPGESIEAQSHDNVTMLFSDLVGFTAICSTATPMEIISLLQSLYTQFDVLCGDLDIYKVITRDAGKGLLPSRIGRAPFKCFLSCD
jgi:class 3 adenylate cyclase